MFNKGKYPGFTLLEALTTIGILGIIAVLTIPALIQSVQDVQYRSAWRRTFTIMNAVANKLLYDNQDDFRQLCPSDNHTCFKNKFKTYLSTIRDCDLDNTWSTSPGASDRCWHYQQMISNNGITKYLNGGPVETNDPPLGNDDAGLILTDGVLMVFDWQDTACNSGNSVTSSSDYTPYEGHTNACGWIGVDVNGFKSPNRIGRDIYGIWFLRDRIVPFGLKDWKDTCASNDVGLGCAAKYLKQ